MCKLCRDEYPPHAYERSDYNDDNRSNISYIVHDYIGSYPCLKAIKYLRSALSKKRDIDTYIINKLLRVYGKTEDGKRPSDVSDKLFGRTRVIVNNKYKGVRVLFEKCIVQYSHPNTDHTSYVVNITRKGKHFCKSFDTSSEAVFYRDSIHKDNIQKESKWKKNQT